MWFEPAVRKCSFYSRKPQRAMNFVCVSKFMRNWLDFFSFCCVTARSYQIRLTLVLLLRDKQREKSFVKSKHSQWEKMTLKLGGDKGENHVCRKWNYKIVWLKGICIPIIFYSRVKPIIGCNSIQHLKLFTTVCLWRAARDASNKTWIRFALH